MSDFVEFNGHRIKATDVSIISVKPSIIQGFSLVTFLIFAVVCLIRGFIEGHPFIGFFSMVFVAGMGSIFLPWASYVRITTTSGKKLNSVKQRYYKSDELQVVLQKEVNAILSKIA